MRLQLHYCRSRRFQLKLRGDSVDGPIQFTAFVHVIVFAIINELLINVNNAGCFKHTDSQPHHACLIAPMYDFLI